MSASDVLKGIAEINGLLEATEETVDFVYRTKSLLGELSEVLRVPMPLDDLRDVEYVKTAIGARLVFKPRRLEILDLLPGEHTREVVFKVRRGDRAEADRLAAYLKYRLYEQNVGDDVVPFTLPDKGMGLIHVNGLAYLEDEFLVLEVMERTAVGTTEEHHVIKIELKALLRVQYNPGVLKDVLTVRPKGRELFDALPGKSDVEVELTVRRRHREAGEALTRRVQAYLESARLGSNRTS
ncbi:MAG: hypothetical protein R2834_21505 [Rhodothermales bacterium]